MSRPLSLTSLLLGSSVLAASLLVAAPTAHAASGDVLPAGTVYCADSYPGHAYGSGPDRYIVDINFPGDAGTPLYAPASGTVSAFWQDTGGNVVTWTSTDGSEKLTLAHLASAAKTGQVRGGDQIGTLGNTGSLTTGAHLHLRRTVNGQPAPMVLSGVQIDPNFDRPEGVYGNCSGVRTYRSAGPVVPAAGPAALAVNWVNYPGAAREIAFATITGGWELFHLGTDNVIYRKIYRGSTPSDWQAIAGPRAKKIAATTSADGRVELFYIGMNDQIYHHWESSPGGGIANWEGLGGYATEIAAARSGGGWEVYHVGGGQGIWRATEANRAWASVPGQATSISAATSRDGRVELFHVGLDSNVYHAWQSAPGSAFGSWTSMGGGMMRHVAASSVGNGEFEVFAVSADGRLWRQAPWSGVGAWQAMNGWASKVAAAKNPDGRVEVAHVGGSGSMWHSWQRAVGTF